MMTEETEKISPIDNLKKYLDKWVHSSFYNRNKEIVQEREKKEREKKINAKLQQLYSLR